MSVNISEIYEKIITKKATEKAKELGIEFQVKHSFKEDMDDVLLRIKREMTSPNKGADEQEFEKFQKVIEKQNEFSEFVAEIVVGT